jgi:phage gp46-like protein
MTSKLGFVWEGDPRIEITEAGADMVYRGGQPVMDRGFENAVLLSLFTAPDWEGNRLLTGKHEAIGSLYESVVSGPITLTSLDRIAGAARTALKWLLESGIASRMEAEAANPDGRQIAVTIRIYPPGGGDPAVLTLLKNGPNWIAQKDDPAYRRL